MLIHVTGYYYTNTTTLLLVAHSTTDNAQYTNLLSGVLCCILLRLSNNSIIVLILAVVMATHTKLSVALYILSEFEIYELYGQCDVFKLCSVLMCTEEATIR